MGVKRQQLSNVVAVTTADKRYLYLLVLQGRIQGVPQGTRDLLPVTPVDSNYDQPPDPTSLFLVAEQSSAVVPSQ